MARFYGVCPSTISSIRHGKCWKHVGAHRDKERGIERAGDEAERVG